MSILSKLIGLGAGRATQAVSRILPASEERILGNLMRSAPNIMKERGGFSFDPRTGRFLQPGSQSGFMMGTLPNNPALAPVQAGGGVARNITELIDVAKQPNVLPRLRRGEYIGGWDEGYGMGLDPARRHLTKFGAIRSGLRTNQAAGFDLRKGETFDVTREALLREGAKLAAKTGAAATTVGAPAALSPQGRDFLSALRGGEEPVVETPEQPAIYQASFQPGVANEAVEAAIKGGKPIAETALEMGTPLIKKLLSQAKALTQEGATAGSDLSNKIVTKLKDQVKVVDGKKELVFGVKGGAKYPTELSRLNIQPIPGLNYANDGTKDILKIDPEIVNEVMKSNIRATLNLGGYKDFYRDVNTGLVRMVDSKLPVELVSGISAPFSAMSSVPKQMQATRSFLEFPGLFPKGATGGAEWRKAIRSTTNIDPLAPGNFSKDANIVKVGSFARNMAGLDEFVTADRHAVQLALGIRGDAIPDMLDPRVYSLFERAYREVAQELGRAPSEIQAESWDIWRRYMLKDIGGSPLESMKPVEVNKLFKLEPEKRKKVLLNTLQKQGRDIKFLEDARLL